LGFEALHGAFWTLLPEMTLFDGWRRWRCWVLHVVVPLPAFQSVMAVDMEILK
jgi:hypothetical protein